MLGMWNREECRLFVRIRLSVRTLRIDHVNRHPRHLRRQCESAADVLSRALDGVAPPVRVVPDPRTNSLLVLGAPEAIRHVQGMIAALDREVR